MPGSPAGAGMCDAQRRRAGRPGEVARHGRGGGGHVGRRVDGDRVASAALDDDGPAEERADRRRLHVETATQQGEPGELRLEVGRTPIQLRPAVDEEPDDAPLERRPDRCAPAAGRSGPAVVAASPSASSAIVPGVALDEQHGRHTGPGQRDGELVDLGRPGRDHGQRRRRG